MKNIISENELTDMFGEECQKCQYYIFIDSGYGYCRRFPPKFENNGKWWKSKWEIKYQLVEWCRRRCGEFKLAN